MLEICLYVEPYFLSNIQLCVAIKHRITKNTQQYSYRLYFKQRSVTVWRDFNFGLSIALLFYKRPLLLHSVCIFLCNKLLAVYIRTITIMKQYQLNSDIKIVKYY